MSNLTVLVLGVGGNVSQGILKALAYSDLQLRVIGACVSPLAMGLYTVEKAYVSPLAKDPLFLEWLIKVCKDENVDVILSGVEPILNEIAPNANRIFNETGAVSIVSPPDKLRIGADKLETCKWLEANGLNFPHYAASNDEVGLKKLVEEFGFPLIAKPRHGKSAEGIFIINDQRHLERLGKLDGYVFQEYLTGPEEFTVGCFCDSDGNVSGTIVMQRELLQGTTYRAKIGEFPVVRKEAERITKTLRPMGPCNIQIRLSGGKPVCFEINNRFSGSTPMRAHFGFNEVEQALKNYVLHEKTNAMPLITEGIALRYWNEIYVEPEAARILQQEGKLNRPMQYKVSVEDYGRRT